MVVVLPELLAPMVLLPLVLLSVLAVPLGLEVLGAVLGVALVVPPASLLGLPLGVVVLGLPLGVAVVAPAAGAALESLLLGVCAMAQPPIARAVAAASVVRVFLVVLISLLLERNPEGIG
jgi:hypothetical protein